MDIRIKALRRFAIAITFLNILGHSILGFEQSLLQLIVSIFTAYFLEIKFEYIKSRVEKRKIKFHSIRSLIDFLLPAHITGLAVSMLIYANEQILPFMFATAVAIGSKEIFRIKIGGKNRHFLNPSNTGIAVTLILFPWIGIAPPYHFTEYLYGAWDWVLPGIILFTGSLLNGILTQRIPLVIGWTGTFIAQAVIRYFANGTDHLASVLPITGMAFVLFTFYMVTDPGTTPSGKKEQMMFGSSVAGVYGLLLAIHVVYTFFFALLIVCSIRGIYHFSHSAVTQLSFNKLNKSGKLVKTKEAS